MKYIGILIVGILSWTSLSAQLIDKERSSLRQGNRAFEKEDYGGAAEKYQSAIAENAASQKGLFNLGDALYVQKNFEESARYFDMAAQVANDKPSRAEAYHNLGNAYMAQQKYKEGLEAYKNALRNNPQDEDTKYNLMYALNKLQQQQQQQQQQQNQDQDKDQEQNKDQNQDQQQQNKEEQKQDQNQDKKDQDQKQDENKDEKGKPQEMKKDQGKAANSMSKEEAEQLLEMLKNQEEKLQEKIQKKKAPKKVPSEKDW